IKGLQDLAAAGQPAALALHQIATQAQALAADRQRGAISPDQYANALYTLNIEQQDISDPAMASVRAIGYGRSEAAAARGGQYALQRQQIIDRFSEQSRRFAPGSTEYETALAQEQADLAKLASSFEQSANLFIESVRHAASSVTAQALDIVRAGAGTPTGAGALASARERAFMRYGGRTPPASLVEAEYLQAPEGALMQGAQLSRRVETMIGQYHHMIDMQAAGGSSGSTFQMRQMLGLDIVVNQMKSYQAELNKTAQSGGPMAQSAKQVSDALQEEIDKIETLLPQLGKLRGEMVDARTTAEMHKNITMAQQGIAQLRGGMTPERFQYWQRAQALIEQNKAAGGNLDPQKAAQYEQTMMKLDDEQKDLLDDARAWQQTMTSAFSTIESGLEGMLFKHEKWKQALSDIGMKLSQIGMNYFINRPLNNFMSSGLSGNGWDFGASGSGASNMLAGLFKGGNSATGAQLSGGGGSGFFGFLGNLFGGNLFGGASIGSTVMNPGFDAGTTVLSGAAYSGLYDPVAMHSGGVVGVNGQPRSLPISLWAAAPRFHQGGLIAPDEVPIIARKGERVLTKEQQVASKVDNHFTFHISTPDANSFRRSQGQIMADTLRHQNVGRRNM
ncbi:MAG: hypothetical protein KGL39_56420, partial [Patescibacteria group bacterium]|nr:hypothetical protein [Patescibacteria group bacterium]